MNPIVKYLLAIVGTGLVLYGSFQYGYLEATEKAEIKRLELVELHGQTMKEKNQKIAEVMSDLDKVNNQTKEEVKTIVKEVVKYVQTPTTVCEFDDDWLRIRQDILRAADSRHELTE
jgi:uncharacterized protein YpuA (DUF1002 family)